ncbi:hypothetical protein Tco_1162684 [Tanacetum coccineum]
MVSKALDIIKIDGPARGLFLNVDKTELFRPVEDPRSRTDGVFPINISRSLNGVKLLGGSVSLDEGFCWDLALKGVSKTISLMEAIHKLHDPQCELLLLRNCAGVAKLSYALRTCSPLYLLEAQVQFDHALRASLEKIVTASGPGFGDWQLRLATLPIKLGGLGLLYLCSSDVALSGVAIASDGPMGRSCRRLQWVSSRGHGRKDSDLQSFSLFNGSIALHNGPWRRKEAVWDSEFLYSERSGSSTCV